MKPYSRPSFLRKQESSPNPPARPERSKAKSKDWMPDRVRHYETATYRIYAGEHRLLTPGAFDIWGR